MLTPFRFGLGGVLGPGTQYVSWIALADAARAFRHALVTAEISGPINAVAPEPVTNRELTETLGRVLHRPTFVPAPRPLLELALGQMAEELLLASTRVEPRPAAGQRLHLPLPTSRGGNPRCTGSSRLSSLANPTRVV
jgi:NAD dependent epimerase/dehydratase family enzyme